MVKNHIMVDNSGYIIHKACNKKGKRHDYAFIKRITLTPKGL